MSERVYGVARVVFEAGRLWSGDQALQKLNLGISAWVEFAVQHFEDGEFMSARSIGYAKVAGTWGIAIRWNGFDPDG